jgi:hyperosmotically inducible protein
MSNIKTLLVSAFIAIASLSVASTTFAAETAGQYVKNSTVTATVKADLLADSDVKSMHIKVNTIKHGVVVLSGTVDTDDQKAKAESIASAAKGVVSVTNKIVVKPAKKS